MSATFNKFIKITLIVMIMMASIYAILGVSTSAVSYIYALEGISLIGLLCFNKDSTSISNKTNKLEKSITDL